MLIFCPNETSKVLGHMNPRGRFGGVPPPVIKPSLICKKVF
jgi:hypothetical protein